MSSFLSRQGKEILRIPFTSSKDGKEHTFKKKRGAPRNLQTKKSGPSPGFVKPLPNAPRREKMSFRLTLGQRRELLYKNSLISWYCKSPSPLKRMEGSSPLVKEDKL